MDISQYVKSTGRKIWEPCVGEVDEKIIEKEDISKLLDAKDDKVHIYAVVTSIYDEEKDIGGGFFATAYNTEQLFSKNYAPAEAEFRKIHEFLKKEHFLFNSESLDRRKIKERERSNVGCSKFRLNWGGSLELLEISFKKGVEAISFGDKIMLSLNSVYLPLRKMEYSDKHKAICYTYEYYTTSYVPILLD